MIAHPDAALLVFAKAPIPGAVKTRLIPTLGAEAAARLQERLVHHTLSLATSAALAPVELWCAPVAEHPFFEQCHRRYDVPLRDQQGHNLGERMAYAFAETLKTRRYALLIGTDCPQLSAGDLKLSFELLANGYRAVLGPAEDGGYVLVGLQTLAPSLFTDIGWGTDQVLTQTREKLAALHLRWFELPTRWDVDRPADLARLKQEQPTAYAACSAKTV